MIACLASGDGLYTVVENVMLSNVRRSMCEVCKVFLADFLLILFVRLYIAILRAKT